MRTLTRIGAAVLIGVAVLVPLSACQPSDTHGVVTARTHHGKWRHLVIREANGRTAKVRVGLLSHAWRHCHIGDRYPACADR